MNINELALEFEIWFNGDQFPNDLETTDVENCVLAWADVTETDLGDNFDNICKRIVELGIC